MLLRLLRSTSRPTAAAGRRRTAAVRRHRGELYLPSLNADIIDNGVITGDTGYILRIGAMMLGVAFVQIVCSVGRRLVRRRDRDELRPRRARRDLPPRRHVLPARGAGLRRAAPDHPSDQRRAAGADARADVVHADGDGADHDGRRHHHGDPRGPRSVLADRGHGAGAGRRARVHHLARWCRASGSMQARIDEVNRLLREQITGVRVVRAFVREPLETERFADGQPGPHRRSPSGPAAGMALDVPAP